MDEPDLECPQGEQVEQDFPDEGLNLHYLVAPEGPGFPWNMFLLCLFLAAALIFLLWLLRGRPEQIVVIHRVADGDSLPGLSLHYYGNSRDWQRIYRENRSALLDSRKLTPGRKLRIPVSRAELERIREMMEARKGRPFPPDTRRRP